MITSENLTFFYLDADAPEAIPALCDVSVKIAAGDFVAVLGHNGSGKSTLARHLNALLIPSRGTLWVGGMNTADPTNTWLIRQKAGMVFQNPDNQIIATIVEEDIAFGPENLSVAHKEIRERVDETLALVGMSEYALTPPHNLSGGQKQRVAIAGVLAMRPECIVLDEPSAMLDPQGRREVMETIMRLNREQGITVILITHFMEEAVRAGRVLVMDAGRVVMDGTPREVFACVEKMRGLGLDVPQMTQLAHELNKRGADFNKDILTIEEMVEAVEKSAKACRGRDVSAPIGKKDSGCVNVGDMGTSGTETDDICTNDSKTTSTTPHIELNNVSHIYAANSVFEKVALCDASLQIQRGEIIAIIGHTGSGKSTLIQHFNALLKPTSGEVLFDGENIHADKKRMREIRQKVGLVFQYPEHQLFEISVYKDVAFGPTRMGLPPSEVDACVKNALEAVGLSQDCWEKSPFELSGGQKRRAAIAGVLAMRPQVLVLDEPTAGLDPQGREEIFAQIKKMHSDLGLTIVIVSHSMDDAARLANRIVVMNAGKIECDGTPSEIFTRGEFLQEIGLDTPQISQLMARLGQVQPGISTHIFTVEDAANALGGLLV